ncbi:metal-dependent hydrolase [Streptacidiphilus jiangxiensis]|uniref:Alanyl-tRNA synthetase n=1 Tax=Streptacidiphilus jiangxiensis TaxID=235985 RepID=A0A1H7JL51_STRJI|nr:metal-dependent hydrolase [Streptacidiphilus jiangxiensis]SEK75353.1 alanyl-tRNA synthetase [Streptacidiphilus jiangxiensis]
MTAPSLPDASTQVTFPAGGVADRSTVVACLPLPDGRHGVVVARTPFHPLDHTWPDQPADTGTLGGQAVLDCVTGGVGPEGEFALGADIPVRRGDEEWAWLVVHVVAEPVAVGEEVELLVDADRRAALCAAHTGCHLLALALNAALAPRWRKDPGRSDSHGNPDFDSLAMDTSRMDTAASYDVYRIGKSLRKKGFTADGLAEDLPAVTDAVNARLAAWVAADSAVRIEAPGPELTARREWHAELPEGHASIFCGGTHLHHLGELAALSAELRLSEDGSELTVTTTPKRA